MSTVIVIGGGLVGCLAALGFAKNGFDVTVYESRPDPRSNEEVALAKARSINLAISARGIKALDYVDSDICERVLKHSIPCHGRMVHDSQGKQTSQEYGLHGETINSINRALLNRCLLDEIDKQKNITVFFDHKFIQLNCTDKKTSVSFQSADKAVVAQADHVIGADGTYSRTRQQLQRLIPMNYEQKYIEHCYLELIIPAGKNGTHLIDANHLHIWPRHEYMLIALANEDGSFTVTLFAPKAVFDELEGHNEKIGEFFQNNFPDFLDMTPIDKVLDCFNNFPKGSLMTVKCTPYNFKDKVIIIGDAAHSTVPFYGQGMNCGFEDVRILLEILKQNSFDFEKSFDQYTESRRKDVFSIIDLSMENYVEMRHKVVTTSYLIRKRIDGWLSKLLGDKWLPLYTMVSFRPDISYSEAIAKETKQTSILRATGLTGMTVTILGTAAMVWHHWRRITQKS